MSTNQSINTKEVPAIVTTLKQLISDKTVSCTYFTNVTKVLSPVTIGEIATLANIRAYIARDPDTENLSEIGRFPPDDLDRLAERFKERAPRLFVLTAAKDYPTMFLHDMVEVRNYDEGIHNDSSEPLLHHHTEVASTFTDLHERNLTEQALVCAPTISKWRFDHWIEKGALPFRRMELNDAWQKLHPGAVSTGWDVELGKEFQQDTFGTEMFALTTYGREMAAIWSSQPSWRGKAVAGYHYDQMYYLL